MATELYPETNTQFLAKMILATREGHQVSSRDARRLSDLASFGRHHEAPTTMPEERRDPNKPLNAPEPQDLINS